MKKEIYYVICHEVARRRYDQKDLSQRILKRVKRKFRENITDDQIKQVIETVFSIYEFTKDKLPQFTDPSTTGYTNPKFIRVDGLEKVVKEQFPDEEDKVLSDVVSRVIYYEYLR